MERPIILNINSAFDWTQEVRDLWGSIEWDSLQHEIAPLISNEDWLKRRDSLILIGLCSQLFIETAYWNWNTNSHDEEDNYEKQWDERQRKTRGENQDQQHRRTPKGSSKGIIEAYGIYLENWKSFLGTEIEESAKPFNLTLSEGPAILLCPERIIEIYPTLMRLGEILDRPISRSSNPMLTNLKMVLLHELGHHFFPVHRSGIGKYVSEGFANRFCRAGIKETERPWLLYKTWYLQPPEYSVYRILNLLENETGKTAKALNEAFEGRIQYWDDFLLPQHGVIQRWENISRKSDHIAMAQAIDYIPAIGFVRNLSRFLGVNWDNWFQRGHLHKIALLEDPLPADFLWDLYEVNDIYPWVFISGLPDGIWHEWRSWPNEALTHSVQRVNWGEVLQRTPYATIRKIAACELGKSGDRHAVATLIVALGDTDARVREEVVEALAKVGDASIVPHLVNTLNQDREGSVRWRIAAVLGQFDTPESVQSLTGTLKDPELEVCIASVKSLERIGGVKAVHALISATTDKSCRVFYVIIQSIVRITQSFQNSDDVKQVVMALTKLLYDTEASHLETLVRTLGEIGGDAAVDSLINFLYSHIKGYRIDVTYELNKALTEVLERLKDISIPKLTKMLDSEKSRKVAAFILSDIGYTDVSKELIALLKDSDDLFRYEVTEHLENIGCKIVLDALINLLDEEGKQLVASVMSRHSINKRYVWTFVSLENAFEGKAINIAKIRKRVLVNLYNNRNDFKEVVEALISCLYDEYNMVRGTAASALGKLAPTKSVDELIKCLERYNDDHTLRSVVWALKGIGNRKAIAPLTKLLNQRIALGEELQKGFLNVNLRTEVEQALASLKG